MRSLVLLNLPAGIMMLAEVMASSTIEVDAYCIVLNRLLIVGCNISSRRFGVKNVRSIHSLTNN